MWTTALLPLVALATILALGVRRSAHTPSIDQEAGAVEQTHRVSELQDRLRAEPVPLRGVAVKGLRNRATLDLGDRELRLFCYSRPTTPISWPAQVRRVRAEHHVGWVVDVDTFDGPLRLTGWLLDVRAVRT